jgi:hypothetical protein
MSIETALLGFIVMQAAFMAWMMHDSHKLFMAMSGQCDRLITMLNEILDEETEPESPAVGKSET